MAPPKFAKVDLTSGSPWACLPARRRAAAVLAWYRSWEPDATIEQAAADLAVPLSTIRRWQTWLDAIGDEAQEEPPAVPADLSAMGDAEAADVLAGRFLNGHARASRIPKREAIARIQDDLVRRRYGAEDLTRFLAAGRGRTCWPRELAGEVLRWLNWGNAKAREERRLAAWSDWRNRIRHVRAGESATQEADPTVPWRVIEVDVERGAVKLWRDDLRNGTLLEGPTLGWTFEAESMPLLRSDVGDE